MITHFITLFRHTPIIISHIIHSYYQFNPLPVVPVKKKRHVFLYTFLFPGFFLLGNKTCNKALNCNMQQKQGIQLEKRMKLILDF
jgi:hypothetical protein